MNLFEISIVCSTTLKASHLGWLFCVVAEGEAASSLLFYWWHSPQTPRPMAETL